MKTIELSDATGTLADYAYQALTEPVMFTLDGKPLAFITSAVGADEETTDLSASPKLRELIERSRESYRKHDGISAAEMRRQVEQWNAEEQTAADREATAPNE